jgi:hypothetical protein
VVELADISESVPSAFVLYIASQATITLPDANAMDPSDVPELRPFLVFTRRYIPNDLLKRSAGQSIFSDPSGNRIIETQAGGNPVTQENTFVYMYRCLSVDVEKTLQQNFTEHASAFDELLQKFHDNYISLVLKP